MNGGNEKGRETKLMHRSSFAEDATLCDDMSFIPLWLLSTSKVIEIQEHRALHSSNGYGSMETTLIVHVLSCMRSIFSRFEAHYRTRSLRPSRRITKSVTTSILVW